MKPPILTKTISLLVTILTLALLGCFTTIASAHPLHAHRHLAPRERVPFWNDPDWGTKAPETPATMATAMPTRPIPSPFLTTPGVASTKATPPPAPTPNNAPLKPAASKSAPTTTLGVVPPEPVSTDPPMPGITPTKPEKSCLDLSLWATASGPSPMMSVAGSLSKNREPICSIWALVDQASPSPVEFSCVKGHEASFRFDNGVGRYRGKGQPVNFDVVRREEAKVDGKEAWSWRVRGCWDE